MRRLVAPFALASLLLGGLTAHAHRGTTTRFRIEGGKTVVVSESTNRTKRNVSTFKVVNGRTHEVFRTADAAMKNAIKGVSINGKPGAIAEQRVQQLGATSKAFFITRNDERGVTPIRVEVHQIGKNQFIHVDE